MSETKVPAIPAPTDNNLREVTRAVKQLLDVREGYVGDPLDRNVTYRALVDSGFAEATLVSRGTRSSVSIAPSSNLGSGTGAGGGTGGQPPDLTPPPAPTGLTATAGLAVVILGWDAPTYGNHAFTEIWRADTNVIGNAQRVGTTPAALYNDALGATGVTRYYWVRHRSTANVVGPYNSTNGTVATTGRIGNTDLGPLIVEASNLASGAVTATKLAAQAVDLTKFATDIEPVSIVVGSTIPTVKTTNTIYLTGTGKLYRWNGTAYVTTVPTSDLTGTVGTSLLADGAVVTAKIADAALTTAKFASSIEPLTVVTGTLPTTKSTNTIFRTDDQKIYRWSGTAYVATVPTSDLSGTIADAQIAGLAASKITGQLTNTQIADVAAAKVTGQLVATQIADATLTTAKFASSIEPITIVTGALPTTKSTNTIYLTNDGKIYRWNGTAYTSASGISAFSELSGSIAGTQIPDGTITAAKIADAALTTAKFASSIEPLTIVTGALPTTKSTNTIFRTDDQKVYRWSGTAYVATVPTSDLSGTIADAQVAGLAASKITGQLTNSQIADLAAAKLTGTISSAQIADGSVSGTKFASSIEPITIVTGALPTTKSTNTIFRTDDQKVYRWSGTAYVATVPTSDLSGTVTDAQIAGLAASKVTGQLTNSQIADLAAAKLTGQVVASQIADASISTAKFASGIEPITVVTSVPGTKSTNSIFNTTDGKLYRWSGSAYVATVPAGDISGTLAASQIASVAASQITGQLTDTQLAAIGAAKVTGQIVGTQITDGAISTAKIAAGAVTAATIAADTITASQIAAGAITSSELAAGAVVAGKIAAGTIQAADIAAGTITGDRLAANTITASQIAADTITAGQIAAGAITASELAAAAVTAGKIAADAVTANEIAANAITAVKIDAGAVTTAKIAAGAVTANEIAASTITGGKIAAATITGSNIAADTITAGQIAAGAITASELAAAAVTAGKIAADAVTANEIAAGAVTTAKIAASAVTANEIAASAITTAKLNAGAVTTAKIAAGAVTATEIAAATITGANIAAGTITSTNIAADTITAGQIAAGAVSTSELAANAVTAAKIAVGTITANEIASATITGTQIAGATITGANIAAGTITASNIAADTITAGQIAAAAIGVSELAAGAVVTGKLLVTGRGAALNDDPGCQDQSAWTGWSTQSAATVTAITDGRVGNSVLRASGSTRSVSAKLIPADPNKTYRLSAWVRQAGNGLLYLRTVDYGPTETLASGGIERTYWPAGSGGEGVSPPANVWTRYSTQFTVPAGRAFVTPHILLAWGGTTGHMEAQDVRIEEAASADLIVDGAITTDKLSANAVTANKIAANTITASQIASATITGTNIAGGTISGSNIAAGTIQASNIAASTITGDKIAGATITASNIAADTITAGQIAAGAISTSELAANAVTAAKIAAGTITADEIAGATITGAKIAGATITGTNIAAGTITASNIASDTITAGQIAAGAISTSELAANAVTAAKLTLTDLTNIAENGDFEAGQTGWDTVSNITNDPANAYAGSWVLAMPGGGGAYATRNNLIIPVTPGEDYYADAFIRGTGTASGYVRIRGLNNANSEIWTQASTAVTGAYQQVSVTGTVPANVVRINVEIVANAGSGTVYADRVRMLRRANASLIVDGAITANKIAANAIAVGTAAIQNGAIVNAMLGSAVVDSAKIADGAITTAKIGDAQITNAKITTLDAGKITTGTLDAGRIAANSITASQINSNGLSIRDNSGNVILAAGSPLAASNITPASGWLNSNVSLTETNGVVSLSGAGSGSVTTVTANNKITSTNVSTYIASAAITNAYIGGTIQSDDYVAGSAGWAISKNGSAEFNTGTFRGALSAATGSFAGSLSAATGTFAGTLTASAINAVNTINIAGNAVTVPVSSELASEVTFNNAGPTSGPTSGVSITSFSIDTSSQPVLIFVNYGIRSAAATSGSCICTLVVNGVVERQFSVTVGANSTITGSFSAVVLSPGSGSYSIDWRIRGPVAGSNIYFATFGVANPTEVSALGAKR